MHHTDRDYHMQTLAAQAQMQAHQDELNQIARERAVAYAAMTGRERRQRRTRRESGYLWLAYAAGYASACVVIGALFIDWLAG